MHIYIYIYIYVTEMLRLKITRQQMQHDNFFRLFFPFIESQNKYLTSNNENNW